MCQPEARLRPPGLRVGGTTGVLQLWRSYRDPEEADRNVKELWTPAYPVRERLRRKRRPWRVTFATSGNM